MNIPRYDTLTKYLHHLDVIERDNLIGWYYIWNETEEVIITERYDGTRTGKVNILNLARYEAKAT